VVVGGGEFYGGDVFKLRLDVQNEENHGAVETFGGRLVRLWEGAAREKSEW